MSKKLIAVASAAALALSALVAAPSSATTAWGVAYTGEFGTTTGTTATDALKINAPSQDVIRYFDNQTATTTTLIRFEVTATAAAATVSATSTGGVKLLSSAQLGASEADIAKLDTADGVQSLSTLTDSSSKALFYAYAESTTAGTVTFNQSGTANSSVFFVKANILSGYAYKLNFTATSTSAAGGKISFTGTVSDAFGNVIGSLTAADFELNGLGGDLTADDTIVDFVQNSTTGVITFDVVNRSTEGAASMQLKMDTTLAPTTGPVKVTAFGTPVGSQFFGVAAVDLSAQVTSLTAQVAALTAQLEASRPKASSVTKKKYNTLARKWNAANPGARVALKK